MKNIYLFFIGIIFFVNGCEKNPTQDLTRQHQKLKKITESKGYIEFTYEGDLLVKKEDKSSDGFVSWSISFTYDEKNRLIAKDVFSPLTRGFYIANSTYEYSSKNLIQKENIYGRGDNLNAYILFEYTKDKITKFIYYSPNDELTDYHILKYEDGNIIKDAYNDNKDSLIFLETYAYDNKQNPLNVDVSPISASSFSRNNITYSIRTWYKRIPPKIYTTVNTYAYNEYGYPVKCFVEYSVSEDVIVSKDTSTMFYEYFE